MVGCQKYVVLKKQACGVGSHKILLKESACVVKILIEKFLGVYKTKN